MVIALIGAVARSDLALRGTHHSFPCLKDRGLLAQELDKSKIFVLLLPMVLSRHLCAIGRVSEIRTIEASQVFD